MATCVNVTFWMSASAVAIITSKLVLDRTHAPGFVCAMQSALGAVCGSFLSRSQGAKPMRTYQYPWLAVTAAAYCANMMATTCSFLYGSTALTETIKALEPAISTVLAIPVLGERITAVSAAAIVLISSGTALACVSDSMKVTFFGAIFALAGVMGSGSFSVIVKVLNAVPNPAAAPGSSGALGGAGRSSRERDRRAESVHPAVLYYHMTGAMTVVGTMMSLGMGEEAAGAMASGLATAFVGSDGAAALRDASSAPATLPTLYLLVLNAIAFSAYHMSGFFLLKSVSVTNYAVLNSVRRVLIIVLSALVFGMRVSSVAVLGILVAAGGVVLHANQVGKAQEQQASPAFDARHQRV